jgi:diguanylate cyclase (GGDEF)-like protein
LDARWKHPLRGRRGWAAGLALLLGGVGGAGAWVHLVRLEQRAAADAALGELCLGLLMICLLGCAALALRPVRRGQGRSDTTAEQADGEGGSGARDASGLYDRLTRLPGRELLHDRIDRALLRRQRDPDAHFALLIADLDGFHVVNQGLGHRIGDRLLVAAARRLHHNLRATDTAARATGFAARLGGDEFVVLLEGASEPTDVERVVERLQQALSQPYELDGHEIVLTASIGVATHEGAYHCSDDVLRDAEIAVSRAKSAGNGRRVFFDAQRHAASVKRLELATALRRAVRHGEFEAYYQPIVQLHGGAVVGFEALLRWNDPERGRISPADFIPLAEELGLIVPIGEWVLTESARQLRAWRERSPLAASLRMSVNVSPRQLTDPGLVPLVQGVLERERLAPDALRLEITESAVMDDPAAAGLLLHRLREIGVGLAMDDFGTGHSSLSSLQRFPFDTLKIDRSFVQQIGDTGARSGIPQTAILEAVITLAHTLGLEVVAEGVEKPAQAEILAELDCDRAQGYLWAAPMPADQAEAFLLRLPPSRTVVPA